jgi:hypothetical protein
MQDILHNLLIRPGEGNNLIPTSYNLCLSLHDTYTHATANPPTTVLHSRSACTWRNPPIATFCLLFQPPERLTQKTAFTLWAFPPGSGTKRDEGSNRRALHFRNGHCTSRIETTLLTKTLAKFWALLRRYWHPVGNSWKFISGPCKCISASTWDKAWCTACHRNKDLQVHLRRLNLFTPRELLYCGSSSPKSRAFSYGGLFYNSRLSVNRWMEAVYKAR